MESNSIKNAREVSGINFQLANNSSQILFEFITYLDRYLTIQIFANLNHLAS